MRFQGQCWCGEVTFECDGEPLFTQYCHCGKCREILSASSREKDKIGYAYTAAYLTNHFKLTSNPELDEIIRNNAKLLLCANCKTLIYGISVDPELQAAIGINANNFIFKNEVPASFRPVRHIWYVDRLSDVNDDLPKYKDAPTDQFGTGELYENERKKH